MFYLTEFLRVSNPIDGFAGWFKLGACHEAAVKHLAGVVIIQTTELELDDPFLRWPSYIA